MFRTNRQRKDLCKECSVARGADIIGDSCSLLIVRDLLMQEQRFTDLLLSLKGISSRTLANKLKHLEARGILMHAENSYALTKKGEALGPVIGALRTFGEKYPD